jgi:hypothetical protein
MYLYAFKLRGKYLAYKLDFLKISLTEFRFLECREANGSRQNSLIMCHCFLSAHFNRILKSTFCGTMNHKFLFLENGEPSPTTSSTTSTTVPPFHTIPDLKDELSFSSYGYLPRESIFSNVHGPGN